MGDEQIMQPAGARKTQFVARVKQWQIAGKQPLGVIEGNGLQKRLGRKPGPAGEQFLQLRRRLSNRIGERIEIGLILPVFGDQFDHPAHGLIVAVDVGVEIGHLEGLRMSGCILGRTYRPWNGAATRFLPCLPLLPECQ